MKHTCASAVVICEGAGGAVRGIFTERDVLRVVLAGQDPSIARVGDHMTKNPTCVSETCDDVSAMRAMAQGRFRHLPVVSSVTGELLGMHDCLALGKSLLNGTSKGMIGRARSFMQSFFASAKKTTDSTELQSLCSQSASAEAIASDCNLTVMAAVQRMAESAASALLVRDTSCVCGIFTERDL